MLSPPAGTLCAMGMVQQLVALVRTEHSPFHEYVLGALCRCAGARRRGVSCDLGLGVAAALLSSACPCSLVTDFPQGVRECREPELGLEELLRHRCQLLQQREEYQVCVGVQVGQDTR